MPELGDKQISKDYLKQFHVPFIAVREDSRLLCPQEEGATVEEIQKEVQQHFEFVQQQLRDALNNGGSDGKKFKETLCETLNKLASSESKVSQLSDGCKRTTCTR
jgi:hypothetical protein